MDLQEKAERLLQRALEVLEDESIPLNRREAQHIDLMQKFCIVQQMRFQDDSLWQSRAETWSKRKQVANKAIADDELNELRALIERLQANSIRLDEV